MKHLSLIVNQLCSKLLKLDDKNTPVMINVSGCMGSGKTTWASAIRKRLITLGEKVAQISEDDFLQPRKIRADLKQKHYTSGKWKGKSYWEVHENWLRLDLMKEAIVSLKNNQEYTYFPYQRSSGELSKKQKIAKPSKWVMFETSIYSELFDLVILIDVDNKILLERKINRDGDLRSKESIRKYHNVVQYPFWQRHRPNNPDFIVNNNDMLSPKLSDSLSY